ncbi:MAG: hypothetical protein RL594_598 [Bacteroidota bacterium]|jgi:dienelactone hydrolase
MGTSWARFRAAVILCALIACASSSIVVAQYFEGYSRITVRDSTRNRNIAVTVIYPADSSSGENKPLTGTGTGKIPSFGVVVFGHGYQMPVTAYKTLSTTVCQSTSKFIIVLPETGSGLFPSHEEFALDMAAAAEYMQREGRRDGSIWKGHIRNETILSGHSMGGGAAFLAAKHLLQTGSVNVAGLVAFAPAETNPSSSAAAASVTCPTLILAGGVDCVTPLASTVQPIYDKIAAKCKVLAVIPGASHCQFADANSACNLGELNCKATITRQAQFSRCWQYLYPFLARQDDFARTIENTQVQTTMVFPHRSDITIDPPIVCANDTVRFRYIGAAKEVVWLPDSVRASSIVRRVPLGGLRVSMIVETCFSKTRLDTIVRTLEPPSVDIDGGSEGICPGERLTLTAYTNATPDNPMSVVWSTGDTTESIVIASAGTYSVAARSRRGCGEDTKEREVRAVEVPTFRLRVQGDTVLCNGTGAAEVSLEGDMRDVIAVQWSTGQETPTLQLTTPGRYVVSAQLRWNGSKNCLVASDTITLNLRSIKPSVPTVRYERDTLWASEADFYEWSFEGAPIPNEIRSYLVPTASGRYAVTTRRTDEGMCAAKSASVLVTLTSVDDGNHQLSVSVDDNRLRVSVPPGSRLLQMTNVRGETVQTVHFGVESTPWVLIDMSSMSWGVYSVSLDGRVIGTILLSGSSMIR